MSSQHNKDKNKGFVSQYQAEDLSRLSLEPFTPMLTPITEGNPGWSPDQKKQGNICSLFSLHLAIVILTFLWPKKALMKSYSNSFFHTGSVVEEIKQQCMALSTQFLSLSLLCLILIVICKKSWFWFSVLFLDLFQMAIYLLCFRVFYSIHHYTIYTLPY